MASSDDETDVGPELVSNYHFVDETDEPISFAVLPIQWSENEISSGNKRHIFLHGMADNGLQKIHKHVTAWKFDLTNVTPEISVLSKEKSWIKLERPRKSFEETIRTILITVYCLSYAKKNPEATEKSIWDHLSKVFSLYEVRPSQNDLVDHMELVSEALKRDDILAKSKFLLKFLEEKPKKRKLTDEDLQTTMKSGFIVDDQEDDMIDDAGQDESNEEDEDLFDSVCSICDNGGNLLCCEGRCMRSFHATLEAGEESQCASLGLTEGEVEAIQNFLCKNCEHKRHQCFICGKLGSSNKASGAEVFPCVSATCGHFYHPHCVSKWLFGGDEVAVEQLRKSILAGESFTCPLHKCYVCKQGENKMESELQFAVCRRCPKAYHRKCLPRSIPFEDEEQVIPRAWEGLLPHHRILIYCLKHEIDEELGTPIRDHIIFPGFEQKKTISEGPKKKQTSMVTAGKEKVVSAKSSPKSNVSFQGKSAVKVPKHFPSAVKQAEATRKNERLPGGSDPLRKMKATDGSRKSLKKNVKSVSVEVDRSSVADGKKPSLGDQLFEYVTQTKQVKLGKRDLSDSELKRTETVKPARKKFNIELPSLDAESERRIMSLLKDAASEVTLKEIQKRQKIPSTHTNSLKAVVDKTITMGKLEGSVEAARTALKKLVEEGSSSEDAKAVCEPEVISQIFKWKNKLRVYLAPFFHGTRYTSFGRHFTKTEKLQEIVDKLHWYVQSGDMIVDFCCGANDFSCLLKKKLDETGKTCSYKNFDILQAKNDFNFEKRDWMTVEPEELAPGSQLIMGLNPPFGVKAALANKFINKALEFNPKLLILIVPPETERLDKKQTPYDLVWEDDQFLTGKSFYLPGSVDENDKQMDQWNLTAPLLYLWSHPDWAAVHRDIAEKHVHLSMQQEILHLEGNCNKKQNLGHPMEDGLAHDDNTSMLIDTPLQNIHGDCGDTSMLTDLPLDNNILGHYGDTSMPTDFPSENNFGRYGDTTMPADLPRTIEVEELLQAAGGDEQSSPDNIIGREVKPSDGSGENQSKNTSRKRKRVKKKSGRQMIDKTPLDNQNSGRHLGSETCKGTAQSSPAKMIDDRSSMEGHMSKVIKLSESSPANVIDCRSPLEGHASQSIEMPSHAAFGRNAYQHLGEKKIPYDSPLNMIHGGSSLEGYPSKSIDTPSRSGFGNMDCQHFEPTTSGSRMQFRTAYHGTNAASITNDMEWTYSINGNEPYSLSRRFPGGANSGYGQDIAGSPPGYGRIGAFPSTAYGHLGLAGEASYRMNASAMDRYRPRLDSMNHQMNAGWRSEQRSMLAGTSYYDPATRQSGYPYGMGFAPGPYQHFARRGNGGWLDP